jgi:hypothetical protein
MGWKAMENSKSSFAPVPHPWQVWVTGGSLEGRLGDEAEALLKLYESSLCRQAIQALDQEIRACERERVNVI